jgi:hypothetical protein
MKKIVFAGVLILCPILNLVADSRSESAAILQSHEHKINFGLLNIGYERVKSDSLYTGVDMKVASILQTKESNKNNLDIFMNGEIRLGYNYQMALNDHVTGYGGVGFSLFSFEKQEGKLKNWNYGTLGVKYLHQFGETFEMGVHMKLCRSISQKRYLCEERKSKPKQSTKVVPDKDEIDRVILQEGRLPTFQFMNENVNKTYHLTAVEVNDTRFLMQLGFPMIWHVGSQKNWEIQLEPYYMQIPNDDLTHIIGSNLNIGYRY